MDIRLSEHYRAVLHDLHHRRAVLVAELTQLDASIAVLERQSDSASNGSRLASVKPDVSPLVSPSHDFSHISVRWATLWLLADNPTSKRTTEIAKALRDGGYPTSMGDRFSNSVSAVLSTMKAKGEVKTDDEGAYLITEVGRSAWEHIRTTDRFKVTQGGLAF